ncbi:MAG: hypothetical protein KDG50_10780 [Chromatiales bacterium]|nr:hypothetical protein [Chromatiales bacterium]
MRFAYDAARNRFLKQTAAATTHYLDKLYERSFETDDQGQPVTKARHFIYVGGNAIAVHTKTEGAVGLIAAETAFMHHDALGSVDTVTDLKERALVGDVWPSDLRLAAQAPAAALGHWPAD